MGLIYNDGEMPPWRNEKMCTKTTFGYVFFVHIIDVHLLESVSAADGVLDLPVSIDYLKHNTRRWTHCLM